MKISSPVIGDKDSIQKSVQSDVSVSSGSIEMLSKLFPNKKRSVLELVLKRCNHDLLKAIEHCNISKGDKIQEKKEELHSAFTPVNKHVNPMHTSTIPFFIWNPRPLWSAPVYVPNICDCDQCKPGVYSVGDQFL